MLGKKQITAKNAKKKPRLSFVCFAFLAVTMQFMGAMSDEGKQLRAEFITQLEGRLHRRISIGFASTDQELFPDREGWGQGVRNHRP